MVAVAFLDSYTKDGMAGRDERYDKRFAKHHEIASDIAQLAFGERGRLLFDNRPLDILKPSNWDTFSPYDTNNLVNDAASATMDAAVLDFMNSRLGPNHGLDINLTKEYIKFFFPVQILFYGLFFTRAL